MIARMLKMMELSGRDNVMCRGMALAGVALFIVFIQNAALAAQKSGGNEQLKLIVDLGLNPLQIRDLQKLRVEFEPRVRGVQKRVDNGSITREQGIAEMSLIRKDFELKAQVILTPEQMAKAKSLIDEKLKEADLAPGGDPPAPAAQPTRKPGPPSDPLLLALQNRLGLSNEQANVLAPLFAGMRNGIRALGEQYEAGKISFFDMLDKANEMRENLTADIEALFSPGQIDKITNMFDFSVPAAKPAGKK